MNDKIIYINGFTEEQIKECEHRGKKIGNASSCFNCPEKPIYKCTVHGACTLNQISAKSKHAVCKLCKDCLPKKV